MPSIAFLSLHIINYTVISEDATITIGWLLYQTQETYQQLPHSRNKHNQVTIVTLLLNQSSNNRLVIEQLIELFKQNDYDKIHYEKMANLVICIYHL